MESQGEPRAWSPQRELVQHPELHVAFLDYALGMMRGECEQLGVEPLSLEYRGTEEWTVESIVPERRGDSSPLHIHYFRSTELTVNDYLWIRLAWTADAPLIGGHSFWGSFSEWSNSDDLTLVRGCYDQGSARMV